MPAPTRFDFSEQLGLAGQAGYHFTQPLTFYQDEAETLPVNLTGFSAVLTLRQPGGVVYMTLTSAGGGIALGGAAGTVAIASASQAPPATAPPAGRHAYALELFAPGGALDTVLRGFWDFLPDESP